MLKQPEAAAMLKQPEAAAMLKQPEAAAMLKQPEAAAMLEQPEAAAMLEQPEAAAMLEQPEAGKEPIYREGRGGFQEGALTKPPTLDRRALHSPNPCTIREKREKRALCCQLRNSTDCGINETL
jgi:hypothetical protein